MLASYPTQDAADRERAYWAAELVKLRKRRPELAGYGVAVRKLAGVGWAVLVEPMRQVAS